MLWDIFCRVIDNFGDIGVCWRLSCDLASRGHGVRLWVDDASALGWMAPEGHPGVAVAPWEEAARSDLPHQPGDVVVEAFGCDPPAAFVQAMRRDEPPVWVNLEYLSAEAYVERSHGLPSPVWHGPGAGLTKRFFYPGFTARTGGLLREPDLMARQAAFDGAARTSWLARLGIEPGDEDRLVSVFCYAHAPVSALLDRLASEPVGAGTTRVLLIPGPAQALAQDWLARAGTLPSHLKLHKLPALPQRDFDHLLWACDLNLVRGEDSAVRALWAGRPHTWHIYPQDDGAHAAKLDAFMSHWMDGWPPSLRAAVASWWQAWNGLAGSGPLPPLPAWGSASAWHQASAESRKIALAQPDLTSQLLDFVTAAE
ncbi:elongation factor P maturation arginine rhamnosyltransferase EarP [Aquabacterium fontiphilum]|jgi:uncharacterized repeat protein (TIGR03837 family)|uniref:elongation factor P maturation arginine rhamnosyltransferase EarP n=1 Tax=Aquabacterium fontiphilum TaxID=450365 RepID=UPI0013774313|nr:elongation factor P maturation arginine rhamnosyltransferase EarP [Aquabacterium fontiphilum]NBD19919.1 elongation factor P maturation arginine rhamnosyltransferase EarP [Aquabacterium fontiphilum]